MNVLLTCVPQVSWASLYYSNWSWFNLAIGSQGLAAREGKTWGNSCKAHNYNPQGQLYFWLCPVSWLFVLLQLLFDKLQVKSNLSAVNFSLSESKPDKLEKKSGILIVSHLPRRSLLQWVSKQFLIFIFSNTSQQDKPLCLFSFLVFFVRVVFRWLCENLIPTRVFQKHKDKKNSEKSLPERRVEEKLFIFKPVKSQKQLKALKYCRWFDLAYTWPYIIYMNFNIYWNRWLFG